MSGRRGVPRIRPEDRPAFLKDAGGPDERVRYWPGKAPRAANQEHSDGEDDRLPTTFPKPEPRAAPRHPHPAPRDPRLERLRTARRRHDDDDDGDHDDVDAARRRRRRLAEAVELPEVDEADERRLVLERMRLERLMATEQSEAVVFEDEDEDEIALRRDLCRERKRAQMHAAGEEEVLPRVDAEDEEPDDHSGEDVAPVSEAEEEYADAAVAKPVFVSHRDRITVKEREKLEEEEKERKEREEQRKQQRKQDTHRIVVEVVRREIEQLQNVTGDSDEDLPSDNDEENEAEEYERWKVREIHRIKAYREEREKWQREKDDILRRRNLTDDQRKREDLAAAMANRKAEEVKWRFLQKYYHKGAFFMDTAEKGRTKEALYDRDYGHATGEDKFDKTTMPQVMQVKNFGKMGRVKWTHLVKEDTTAKATEDAFTTGTAVNAVGGSAHYAHNMTYNNQHFTYAFAKQEAVGSAKYGAAHGGGAKETLLERPAARRRNQK